jgi:hypothetical protein
MSLNGNNAHNISNVLKSSTRKWSNMSPWDFMPLQSFFILQNMTLNKETRKLFQDEF